MSRKFSNGVTKLMPWLAQFRKHPVTALWMNESNECSVSSLSGILIDHPATFCNKLCNSSPNIFDFISYMVDTLAVLLQKLCHRAVRRYRFQQLDLGFSNAKHRYTNLLLRNIFTSQKLHSQLVTVEWDYSIDRLHCDADMVNFVQHF